MRIGPRDRRGTNRDKHLVVLRDGALDLSEVEHLGGPVPVMDDRSHDGFVPSVRTTLPVFCPVSTYLVASTTSSSGYVRSMTARYFPASMSSFRMRTSSFL